MSCLDASAIELDRLSPISLDSVLIYPTEKL